MKIAMLGHKRMPGREGGIEVVVEELTTRMAEIGHKLTVYNRHKKKYFSPKEFKGVKIVDVPTIERQSTDAVVYSFLASILAAFGKYDIVHYHAIGPSAFLFIPHFFRKKTIVTVHGLNYKTPKWKGFASKFIKFGEKIAVKYADHIIVLSHEQQKYFMEKYGRRTEYIPNGTVIYDMEPCKEIKEKYKLEHGGYLLYLSRVVPGKGLEYLLDAFKSLSVDIPLIIAGDTEYVPEFKKKIEAKVKQDPRVKLIGFVEGKILRELYSNAKLFIFPSEAEGMPMCLLEAMSYDCPCLVSNIPENLEVGQDYVVSFESKNVLDLQTKLKAILSGEIIVNHKSRDYIQQNFSWDEVVKKTLECYEK